MNTHYKLTPCISPTQVGHDLRKLSVETKFENEDPEEDEEKRRRLLALEMISGDH